MSSTEQIGTNLNVIGKPWYHGMITRQQAEHLLRDHGQVGDFLIRKSESDIGNYALSIKSTTNIRHIKLLYCSDGMWKVNHHSKYHTIEELLENWKKQPKCASGNGVKIILNKPVSLVHSNQYEDVELELTNPKRPRANVTNGLKKMLSTPPLRLTSKNHQQSFLSTPQQPLPPPPPPSLSSMPSPQSQSLSPPQPPLRSLSLPPPLPLPRMTSVQPLPQLSSLNPPKMPPRTHNKSMRKEMSIVGVLDCSICLDTLKKPIRMLSCGHNYCTICLTEVCNSSSSSSSSSNARCPICRKNIKLGSKGVTGIPRNFTLEDMIDRLYPL